MDLLLWKADNLAPLAVELIRGEGVELHTLPKAPLPSLWDLWAQTNLELAVHGVGEALPAAGKTLHGVRLRARATFQGRQRGIRNIPLGVVIRFRGLRGAEQLGKWGWHLNREGWRRVGRATLTR